MHKAYKERRKGNTIRVAPRLISPDRRAEGRVWHGYLPDRGYFGFLEEEEARPKLDELDPWDKRKLFLNEFYESCKLEGNTLCVATDAAKPLNNRYQATCAALVYRHGSRAHVA